MGVLEKIGSENLSKAEWYHTSVNYKYQKEGEKRITNWLTKDWGSPVKLLGKPPPS